MMKKLNLIMQWLIFALFICFALVLSFGGNFNGATIEGIKLWASCVLPALFPYFFITAVLSSLKVTSGFANLLSPFTKKIFNTGGASGFAFFMSLLSGYPIGAKVVSDLRKNGFLSSVESVRASAFCSTSSPMFLIGSVGTLMFNNKLFGVKLLLVHILSSIIVGFIFSFYKKSQKPVFKTSFALNNGLDNILYESVYSSVISILVVGGLITLFYLLTHILLFFNLLDPVINLLTFFVKDKTVAKSLALGFFECTQGLKVLSTANLSSLSLPIACFICGFGGLSVIAQSVAYLKSAKIKVAPFIFAKLLGATVNFILGLIFCLV